MYHRRLVIALAAGTAIVGTMIPVMSSASAHKPSLVGCAVDSPPPTTVVDDGTDSTTSTATTVDELDEAPATSAPDDADVAPSSEAAVTEVHAAPPSSAREVDDAPATPPSTETVSDVPDESIPTPSDGVDAAGAATASGFRSTGAPAADPIKHKYEITVKITMVKGKSRIDKWEFTPHGNPCRLTGVEWAIGVGGEPGSYFEYYTLVITDPALDKDKCRPLIYVNGSSTALTGVTRIEANPNFTAVFSFDRQNATETEFRIVIECS